ncbi:ATP-binding sensor histidine kinase [Aquibacillus rhizosphaerae]|uniref:histidine kinase n=1 Tax=Aquibacillus rhizosphaerae TaxID=3051431 RepID=A0ABT7KZT8_9BACI|nr:ATP-binding sensor histidine kinase [Aquibacillus sp. LR5S19]MDL4839067.1 ATP-binding sensor histidine kinase [Aquibacillus sp. LR5S19]
MKNLSGYHIIDKYIENDSLVFYKALSIESNNLVLLKERKSQRNHDQTIAESIHEYHMLKDLNIDGVLKPLELKKNGLEAYIVTEQFSGELLSDWLVDHSFELNSFLKFAMKLTTTILHIHQNHIIHKAIHPEHILYNSKSNELKLTGFHQSTKLMNENQQTLSAFQVKYSLDYISPEQTGRMNRTLDHRTDLYSLGVLFYEVVVGSVPFAMEDPMEVIHGHLAQMPIEPHQINKDIPLIISNLIMKLLNKMPEDRYQSAFGLKEDLERCFTQLNTTGELEIFTLADKDSNSVLEKPNKLYGRKYQIKQIYNSFEQVQKGVPILLLVPGPSGIGKTALVNELHAPIIKQRGYFISGKFVQLEKQIPYAPLIQAFQSLIRQILKESPENINVWKDKLIEALGANANVLANFIPEIKWIIGTPTKESPELPPQGVHHRFRLAVRKFVDVFATKAHPLVLFLDDLQWSDDATLDLVEHLLTTQEDRYLFVVGAYRDNEIEIGHPFEALLKNIKDKSITFYNVPVEPLEYNHILEWVEEVFSIDNKSAVPLVEIMFRITKGNPFFIIQLFQSLYEDKVISFDSSKGNWQLKLDSLKYIPVTETILDIIIKRIDRLPEETKKILQLASCFGNQFNLKSLATIASQSYSEVAEKLWNGLEEGHIIPLDDRYKWVYPDENLSVLEENPPSYLFIHDKVQQAFYSSMSVEKRKNNHLIIGQELVKHFTQKEIDEHIFAIVNHLNLCSDLLSSEQRVQLTRWNINAGEKAKGAAAFDAALNFFFTGSKLLAKDSWENHYEITRDMLTGLGESQYLNHMFEEAEKSFEQLLYRVKTKQEKLSIYQLKITLYTHIHKVMEATNSGLTGLSLFGWKFKENPSKLDVAKEYMLTKFALGRKKTEDLLNLSPVTDPDQRLIMRTLINTNAPTYHVNQNLATILMLRAIRQMLKYGDMDLSALVYNNYALTLSAGFNDYDGSYKYGKLAIEHAEKNRDTALQARVYFVFGTFVNHWKHHIRYNLDYLERSQQLCIETGNLHLAGANGPFIALALFIKGESLEEVTEGIERQWRFANKNDYRLSSDLLEELNNWITYLRTPKGVPEWEFEAITDDASAEIIHKTLRLQMSYLFNEYGIAQSLLNDLKNLVDDTLKLMITPDYYFYHSLWTIRLTRQGNISRLQAKRKLKKSSIKLKNWTKHSPENYRHKYLLVKAEITALTVKSNRIITYYDQAISLAEENGFIQDVAIANECAGHYYLANNVERLAMTYMTGAYEAYIKWGAQRQADALYHQYPNLIMKSFKEFKSAKVTDNNLDFKSMFQAAQVISGEIILDQLLRKMMNIVLINAGAEHAYFIMYQDLQLQLVASNHVGVGVEIHSNAIPIKRVINFSTTIVNYVASTQESVVLEDAAQTGAFVGDTYIVENQIKSVLCVPILHQNKLIGILYLENNQSSHVFTRERIDLLTLLSSQVAVSIENAYLYANLEKKVNERTELLNEANQNLITANQELAEAKEMRRQLLSNVSHDLRSPIAAIQGYIDAFLDGLVEDPDKQRDYLQIMKKRVQSLDALIQDLFELAKLENGKNDFNVDVVPIDQLFTHLCSQFELEVQQAGFGYKWELPPLGSVEYLLVEVDILRIEQVMTNLVMNAINYTDTGLIEITIHFNDSKEAIIGVKDQGFGIPKSEIPFVFDRFYTKSNQKMTKGNGLGLSICKEIITQHNGMIWVESEEGQGTTFYFSLPMFDVDWFVEEDLATSKNI